MANNRRMNALLDAEPLLADADPRWLTPAARRFGLSFARIEVVFVVWFRFRALVGYANDSRTTTTVGCLLRLRLCFRLADVARAADCALGAGVRRDAVRAHRHVAGEFAKHITTRDPHFDVCCAKCRSIGRRLRASSMRRIRVR
jgi:hypothetical protein